MKKPTITLSVPFKFFLKDGEVISDATAREIWDAGSADWSQGAYQEMARRVMAS